MTGELLIDGYDVYREYGVTPLRGTFNEVMRPVNVKSPLKIEIENQDGEEIYFPDNNTLIASREITIPVALVAYNANDFLSKKRKFEELLRKGMFFMYFSKIDTGMNCYLVDFQQYTQLEDIEIGQQKRVSATLNIKLKEPNPANRGLNKDTHAYGVVIDETQSNPDLERVGNDEMAKAALVNELAVQGTLQNGYLKRFQKDNGLRYEDGTPSITDGSAGNVVTHMPPFYFLNEQVTATKSNLYVSPYPVEGFTWHPGFTLGSFKASMNNTSVFGKPADTLWSVINTSTIFRGGNNDPTNDNLQKGYLGKPRTSQDRTDFWNAAQNQGSNYGIIGYHAHQALIMLFVTKYATLLSQKAVITTKDANGFYHGGLGAGVTTVISSEWSNYNGYNPLVQTGITLSLGLTDGEVDYTITDFNVSGDITVKQNSFLGIEGVFGDLWEWLQDINIWKQTVAEGDKFKAFIYDPNDSYENTIGGNHKRNYEFVKTQGWLKSIVGGSNFEVLGKETDNGASSSTFFTDYFYNNDTTGVRGLLRGGKANNGSNAGLSYATANNAPSHAAANVGSRLGYYGQVKLVV
jgi:hypothetical protein